MITQKQIDAILAQHDKCLQLSDLFYKRKTKKAKERVREQLTNESMVLRDLVDDITSSHKYVPLNSEVLCIKTFGGGGYGVSGTIQVLDVYESKIVFAGGNEVFEFVTVSNAGWFKHSFKTFAKSLINAEKR